MAATAANIKNAAHIVRVLSSGCRGSTLMSGSFLGNRLRGNSPVTFDSYCRPSVRRPAEAVRQSCRKERARARCGVGERLTEPGAPRDTDPAIKERDRASLYGANTMARWPEGASANGRWQRLRTVGPSTDVPGGGRFGGELMTDNSGRQLGEVSGRVPEQRQRVSYAPSRRSEFRNGAESIPYPFILTCRVL